MCGRTACTLNRQQLIQCIVDAKAKKATDSKTDGDNQDVVWFDGHDASSPDGFRLSNNIPPSSLCPILLDASHMDKSVKPSRKWALTPMRWGLVPSWNKQINHRYSMNNCRAETIKEKPAYKRLFLSGQRCVLVVDGFYEWKRQGKQPYFFYSPQDFQSAFGETKKTASFEDVARKPLFLAALFDVNRKVNPSEPLFSFTVLTTESSSRVSWCHDRMPVVLETLDDLAQWIDPTVDADAVMKYLKPSMKLDFHAVSKRMSDAKYQGPDCWAPIETFAVENLPAKTKQRANGQGTLDCFVSPRKRKQDPVKTEEKKFKAEPKQESDNEENDDSD